MYFIFLGESYVLPEKLEDVITSPKDLLSDAQTTSSFPSQCGEASASVESLNSNSVRPSETSHPAGDHQIKILLDK